MYWDDPLRKWPKLPQLTTTRVIHTDTGKRRKHVVSSQAWPRLQQLGAALADLLCELMEELDDDDQAQDIVGAWDWEDDDCLLTKEDWPKEWPEDPDMETVLPLLTTFIHHLRKYQQLLEDSIERAEAAAMTGKSSSMQEDRWNELQNRVDDIQLLLDVWDKLEETEGLALLEPRMGIWTDGLPGLSFAELLRLGQPAARPII